MNYKTLFLVFLMLLLLQEFNSNNKNKSTRFDKAYRDCNSNTSNCGKYLENEDCVYKCMSIDCYNKAIGDYIWELGEMNFALKSNFEKCFNNYSN